MATPRHQFYENDEKLTLEIFDKGVTPDTVKIKFASRAFSYEHGDKLLVLQPLKGEIDPDKSSFEIRTMKVEITFIKRVLGRWVDITGDSPDPLSSFPTQSTPSTTSTSKKSHKNWDGITQSILESDKPLTSDQDPNIGGDSTVNEFFQKLYSDADEDTRRAMMKSYVESGGTTLSTNWEEVGKAPVTVKPPEGSEYKKWGE